MRVRIARSAETDLLEGYAFYEGQQAGIGEYFLDSLFIYFDPGPLSVFHTVATGEYFSENPALATTNVSKPKCGCKCEGRQESKFKY